NQYQATISMREEGKVSLHQFWFPGWNATVDGRPAELAAAGKPAIVSCDVPAGEHVLEFNYTSLPQRRPAGLVSLGSLAVAVGLVVLGNFRAAKGLRGGALSRG
ncbi:MAG: hypothetical protein ABR589_09510, partial [Chthoniobacterales bacterium]